MICLPPSTFRLARKYYCSGVPSNLVIAFVYSADVDLHICSISSDVVNTAATGAIAMLDSIYDTSNMDIGPSLRSISLDSGTIVSLRNRSYSLPHPRDSRISRTDFRIKLSRLVPREKYSRRIIHPLQNRENIDVRSFIRSNRTGIRNVAQGFAIYNNKIMTLLYERASIVSGYRLRQSLR